MRKPLISTKALKKLKYNFLLLNIILLILPFFVGIHSLLILHNVHYFFMGVGIFLTIYLVADLSFLIGYLLTPSKIVDITNHGFSYVPVIGKKKEIAWQKIESFKHFKNLHIFYIRYKGLFGYRNIPIDEKEGIILLEAWEKWREGQGYM